MQCQYCSSPAKKTIVWLKDADGNPIEDRAPWCGVMNCVERQRGGDFCNSVLEYRVDYEVERLDLDPLVRALCAWASDAGAALSRFKLELESIEGLDSYGRREIYEAIDKADRSWATLEELYRNS